MLFRITVVLEHLIRFSPWQLARRVLIFPLRLVFYMGLKSLRFVVIGIDAIILKGRLLTRAPWRLGIVARFLFRQTPKVLVCMPFGDPACESMYRHILKPIVKWHLGGKCVRISHPVPGDWRESLRESMLFTHVTVFDLSLCNENVLLEKSYHDELMKTFSLEKRMVCISYDWNENYLGLMERGLRIPWSRKEFEKQCGHEIVFYEYFTSPIGPFADALQRRLEEALEGIGFQRGFFDPWVVYPKTPEDLPGDVSMIDSVDEALEIRERWKKDARL